jgi:hypothetical protein
VPGGSRSRPGAGTTTAKATRGPPKGQNGSVQTPNDRHESHTGLVGLSSPTVLPHADVDVTEAYSAIRRREGQVLDIDVPHHSPRKARVTAWRAPISESSGYAT